MAVIPWSTSASLKNVVRGGNDMVEVTSLEGCVRAWLMLDPAHQADAELVPERAFQFEDDGPTSIFRGGEIAALARHLPV